VRRLVLASALLIVLASSSGCCLLQEIWYALPCCGCHRCSLFSLKGCLSPCACQDGCGEVYYGEISDPPACPEPCDHCGRWTGYPGYMPGGHHYGPPMAEPVYSEPTPAPTPAQPTPAASSRMGPPSDAEMGLPAGAKIISRSDRLVSKSSTNPAGHTAPTPARTNPTQTAMRPRRVAQRRPWPGMPVAANQTQAK
jgi:hypothetical protein